MPTLTLPGPLLRLVDEVERATFDGRSARLDAATWAEFTCALRARYPSLAEHVLGDETVREGIVLVINGSVAVPPSELAPSDQVTFIAQISGG